MLAIKQDMDIMTNEELASSDLPVIITRYAMREDLAEVLDMYIAALDEIQDYIEPYNVHKCADLVLKNWVHAPCILLEKAGELIGFAGFAGVVPEFSDSVTLREYMFFIKPEHRSYKAAKVMSDAAQQAARDMGVPLYMSHMVFDKDTATKEKFLKRWGYKVISMVVKYV